jgi:hypothetical protein
VRLGGEEKYGSTALCGSCVIKVNIEEGKQNHLSYLNVLCLHYSMSFGLTEQSAKSNTSHSNTSHSKDMVGHTSEEIDNWYYENEKRRKLSNKMKSANCDDNDSLDDEDDNFEGMNCYIIFWFIVNYYNYIDMFIDKLSLKQTTMAAELQSASNVPSTNNIVVDDAKDQGKFIYF